MELVFTLVFCTAIAGYVIAIGNADRPQQGAA